MDGLQNVSNASGTVSAALLPPFQDDFESGTSFDQHLREVGGEAAAGALRFGLPSRGDAGHPAAIDPATLPAGPLSSSDYHRVAERNVYLASKYDPQSLSDRALNLVTGKMDDPANVLTDPERAEHRVLSQKLRDTIDPPPTPQEARLDAMEQSPFGAIASEATRQAGGGQRAQDLALGLGSAADGMGMGYLGLAGDPAGRFLGGRGQFSVPRPDAEHEAPAALEGMAATRTPGLPDQASMADLVQAGAIPGPEGVTLTDKTDDPSKLFSGMGQLTEKTGLEYALVRHDGDLVLYSGAPGRVQVPRGVEPLAHTHPPDATGAVQALPSRTDVNVLNQMWAENPSGPQPRSAIIWGSLPDQVTSYGATGTESITDPTKGGLKPGRAW